MTTINNKEDGLSVRTKLNHLLEDTSFQTLTEFKVADDIGYEGGDTSITVSTGDYIRISSTGTALKVLAEGAASEITGTPVPVSIEGATSLEFWEATGDGVASDTTALTKALSSGKKVVGTKGAVYLIDSAVSVTDVDVDWDFNGSELKFSGDDAQVAISYSYSDVSDITALDNDATINMNDGTGGTSTPSCKITLASASAYAAGDRVKVVSDDIINGTDPADTNRCGEHAVIFSVVGNDIYLDRTLTENGGAYTTNPRIAKASTLSCNIEGIQVDGDYENNATRSKSHIRPLGCANLSYSVARGRKCQGPVVSPTSCFEPKIGDCYFEDGKTISGVGAFAHGSLLVSCTDVSATSVRGRNMRHLIDTSGQACAADDEIYKYGGTINAVVDSIYGTAMQAPPASTHADATGFRFNSVVSLSPIHGPNGYFGAAGFRGRGHHVEYVECEGGDGVRVFTDYASNQNSTGHTVGDVVLRSTGRHNQQRAVYILGQSGGDVGTIPVRSVTWDAINGDNISYIVRAKYGAAEIGKIYAQGQSEADSVDLLLAEVDGGITVDQLIMRDAGSFTLASFSDDSGSIDIRKADIETATSGWGSLADMAGYDATFKIKDTTINLRGNQIDLVQNRGASATTETDWFISEAAISASSRTRMRLGTLFMNTASTTYSIDIGDRVSPLIYVNIICSATGTDIDTISEGAFFGQRLILQNKYGPISGTETFTVTDNASGNVRTGPANVTLDAGRSLMFIWDGSDWRVGA